MLTAASHTTSTFNRHAHGSPHPTLTAASYHFNCTPSQTPCTSQLDCNRNPTTSPLPLLRDVGTCNHSQQVLSARSNEGGGDKGQTKQRVRRRARMSPATNARRSAIPHPTLLVLSGPPVPLFKWKEGGTTVAGKCASHTPPRLHLLQLMSSTRQRVSHTPPCFLSLSFLWRHLQCQCKTLAPPPSLIDMSRRGGCLPHRAVDAVRVLR